MCVPKPKPQSRLRSGFLAAFLAISISAWSLGFSAWAFKARPPEDGLPGIGIELEVFPLPFNLNAELMEDSAYKRALQEFQKLFGGNITVEEKGGKWGSREAWLIDDFGRKTKVVAEGINSPQNNHLRRAAPGRAVNPRDWIGGMDGTEVVSDILTSHEEVEQFDEGYQRLIQSGGYRLGLDSSTHFSVSAFHLIEPRGGAKFDLEKSRLKLAEMNPADVERLRKLPDGPDTGGDRFYEFMRLRGFEGLRFADATKLGKTILYLESHLHHLIAANSPIRNGTFSNRYNIPLSAQQPELMNTIQNWLNGPEELRTFGELRKIFLKYWDHELELRDGDENQAYKYRALQYKKIFGLGDFDAPDMKYLENQGILLEFRTPEAPPGWLGKLAKLFRVAMVKGHTLYRNKRFPNPFEGIGELKDPLTGFVTDEIELETSRFSKIEEFNARILEQNPTEYQRFLEELGFTAKDYPPFWKIPNFERFKSLYLGKIGLSRARFYTSISSGGQKVAFMADGQAGSQAGRKTQRSFRSLVDKVARENPASAGQASAEKTLVFTAEIPASLLAGISKERLENWTGRIRHYLSNLRKIRGMDPIEAATLTERGTTSWTLRIPSSASELDAMARVAQMVEVGLRNPSLIRSAGEPAIPNTIQLKSGIFLFSPMGEFYRSYVGRELTGPEKDFLQELALSPAFQRIPDPFRLEEELKRDPASVFNAFEITHLEEANLHLKIRIQEIMQHALKQLPEFSEDAPDHLKYAMGISLPTADHYVDLAVREWGRTAEYGLILESMLLSPYLAADPDLGVRLWQKYSRGNCSWRLLRVAP